MDRRLLSAVYLLGRRRMQAQMRREVDEADERLDETCEGMRAEMRVVRH
jgi:hypothetical protein